MPQLAPIFRGGSSSPAWHCVVLVAVLLSGATTPGAAVALPTHSSTPLPKPSVSSDGASATNVAAKASEPARNERRVVAACVPPQRWLLEKLVDDRVHVVVLVEPGMSHETFSPSDAQAGAILGASMYLALGLPHERAPWFRRVRDRLEIVDCRVGVPARELEGHAHDHSHSHDHDCTVDGADPHIWTAPGALKIQAKTIATALRTRWPSLSAHLDESLPALELELDALDAELKAILAPCRDRPMFVFHPAWGYFTEAYGLRQVAIEREGKGPTDRELVQLQRQARDEGVTTIFVQPQIDSRAAHAVARGIGGRVVVIDPLVEAVDENLRSVARTIAESCR